MKYTAPRSAADAFGGLRWFGEPIELKLQYGVRTSPKDDGPEVLLTGDDFELAIDLTLLAGWLVGHATVPRQ